jgi:hypothetical protein
MVPRYTRVVQDKIQKALDSGRLDKSKTYICGIFHDDWCQLLAGTGLCNCDFEIGPIEVLNLPNPENN